MKSSHRKEMLQISFAILGLLFACMFAGIVINLLVTDPTSSELVLSHETQTYLEDMEQYFIRSTQSKERGHRRLALSSINYTNSLSDSKPNSPTLSPSPSPTVLYEQILPPLIPPVEDSSKNSTVNNNNASAIVVGFASCIIVFAALLYAYDIRERIHEKAGVNQNKSSVNNDKVNAEIQVEEGSTSAGSTGESGYWISTSSGSRAAVAAYPMLPPLDKECDSPLHGDELSISRLSTMTDSRMESPWSFGVDATLMALETSSQVTELSEEHLVPLDTSALASLISRRHQHEDGDDDSLTSVDEEEPPLYRGKWDGDRDDDGDVDADDEEAYQPMDSPRPSFEYSPTKYYTPNRIDACDSIASDFESIANQIQIQFEGLDTTPHLSRSKSSSTVDLSELENASEV